jgi:hypothetical protein
VNGEQAGNGSDTSRAARRSGGHLNQSLTKSAQIHDGSPERTLAGVHTVLCNVCNPVNFGRLEI